jgi:hypothetical protein
MPGKYLHGALVEFTETFPLPIPNVIIFQYNPESIRHDWKASQTSAKAVAWKPYNPLAIRGSPQENFAFTLIMDSSEQIADGTVGKKLAIASGIQPRLAALELLLFPTAAPGGGLIGTVSAAFGISHGAKKTNVPAATLPMVLLVWGPGRIVPVRVARLSVTEKLYDAILLNPTHAEAEIELAVLTKEELPFIKGKLGTVARAASTYTERLRQALALANLDNATASVIGMLPV